MGSTEIPFTRVNRTGLEAEAYYSRLSRIYDWLAASEKKYIRQGLALLQPREGERILEIGFGTGFAQDHLIRAVGGGLSAGVDLSTGMGIVSREKLTRAGLEGSMALVISNSLPIPFQDAVFNAVFSSFTLELFDSPHIPRVLAECLRVLLPGGRLVLVCLSKDRPLGWIGRLYEGFHARFPTWADCRPIPALQLVAQAGFSISQATHTSMWGLPVIILESRK